MRLYVGASAVLHDGGASYTSMCWVLPTLAALCGHCCQTVSGMGVGVQDQIHEWRQAKILLVGAC